MMVDHWKRATQRSIQHRKRSDSVAKMMDVADAESRVRRANHPGGNICIRYLNERRAAHKATGGSWEDRAGLEETWLQEWRSKTPEEKQLYKDAVEAGSRADALQALAELAGDQPLVG